MRYLVRLIEIKFQNIPHKQTTEHCNGQSVNFSKYVQGTLSFDENDFRVLKGYEGRTKVHCIVWTSRISSILFADSHNDNILWQVATKFMRS